MALTWTKPTASELSAYQKKYIDLVPDGDLNLILENNFQSALKLVSDLSNEKLNFRYASGKWCIPEIMIHICDCERIFVYRILCIARGDKTPLPGFDENNYAKNSNASERNFTEILNEFRSVRNATLSLLKSLNEKNILNKGISNSTEISVQQIAYMLAGHELHHLNVIKQKYLS